MPFPFAFQALLDLPRPFQSPKQLIRILEPGAGEWILEIGPGVGVHALAVALSVAGKGTLGGAARRSIGRCEYPFSAGDAARLPYPPRTFDGAYLIGTLGEIPDRDGALRELAPVLKPAGRLVIGEMPSIPISCHSDL